MKKKRPDQATAETLTDALVAAVEAIVRCGDGQEPEGTLETRARRLFTARRAVVEAITASQRSRRSRSCA